MPWIFFIFSVLIVPGLPSGGTVPRWAFMFTSLSIYALIYNVKIPSIIIFTWVCLALSAFFVTPYWGEGAYHLIFFTILALAFCIGQTSDEIKPIFTACALGLSLNSIAIIFQYFGWNGLPAVTAHAGLFINHNLAGEFAGIVVAGLLAWKLWWLLPGLIPTLLAGNRSSLLALGIVSFLLLWNYSRFYSCIAFLTACLAVTLVPTLSETIFNIRTFDAIYANYNPWTTLQDRVAVWQDTISGLTWWGHGLGSFDTVFPFYQVHTSGLFTRFDHPHNDYLQLAFDLGLPGVLGFGYFLANLFIRARGASFYILLAAAIESFFGFPLYNPVSGVLAALIAGHAFRSEPCLCCICASKRLGVRYGLTRAQPIPLRSFEDMVAVKPRKAI